MATLPARNQKSIWCKRKYGMNRKCKSIDKVFLKLTAFDKLEQAVTKILCPVCVATVKELWLRSSRFYTAAGQAST